MNPDIILILVIFSRLCHSLDNHILESRKVYLVKSFGIFYVTRPQPSGALQPMRESEISLPLTWACCYGSSHSNGICMWVTEKLFG